MKNTRPEAEPKVVATQVLLPPSMICDLDRQAEREGLLRGRSAMIRRACAQYLASTKRGNEPTEVAA